MIRLAGRDPEALEGELPELSSLHRVCAAGELDEPARVHFILHRLIADYLERLPAGRDCRAIRELMTCCLLYTSPSPRDRTRSRMPSSA